MPINQNRSDLNSRINKASTFKQLEIFIKIVESDGFSGAASKLNLTPSAVSHSLSKLEQHLGVILLKRTTRSIVLTETGEYLYHRAVKLLYDLDESLDNTASFHKHPQGKLRITCSLAFGMSHLIRLFDQYKKIYPEVDLLVDLNDNFVNLNESDFDLALRITNQPPENYATRKLAPIHWVYCASLSYLEKHGEPQNLLELESHSCLVYPEVWDAWKYKDPETGIQTPLKIPQTIQANSSLFLLQAALNHMGVAYLPTYLIGDHIQRKHLKPLLLNDCVKTQQYALYALYFPCRFNNPKIRSFIDFIMETLSPKPPWDHWMEKNTLPTEEA